MRRLDALVLDLDTRGGLAVARALGRAGLRVAVASRVPAAPGLRTRHAAARAVLGDPAVDARAARARLLDWLAAHPADAVLTTTDPWLEVLARSRAVLPPGTSPALPAGPALTVAGSKAATLTVAGRLGIPVPRSIECRSVEDVLAALPAVGLPAVLKPVTPWRDVGRGGERVCPVLVRDAAEAGVEAARLVRADAPVLVQEYAEGERETHKLFRADGRWVTRLVMRPERTWPALGGSSTMRVTIPPPVDSHPMAEALVEAVGLEGYAEVEFRRDRAGRPLLMEVNARLSQSVDLCLRAGVDVTRLQLEWARGGTLPTVPTQGRVGVRLGWAAGDARLLLAAARGGAPPRPSFGPTAQAILGDYLRGRAGVEGLDLRDVRPLLAGLAAGAQVGLRAARRPAAA